MRSRTVAKLGMALSVVLFCTAVGFYGFAELSATDKGRDLNLYSLVPADNCIGVLESDNVNLFIGELPQLNYSDELDRFQFPGLFDDILSGLNEYTMHTAHGLSGRMSRVVVSFHVPGTPRDQVVYFRVSDGDKKMIADMLQDQSPKDFQPKKEKHNGEDIYIYPMGNDDFLSVYSETGFLAVSYEKRLIEQVIDAKENSKKSLINDPVFVKATAKNKSHNFLTLYARTLSMPLLQQEDDCWSEFDFHMNSDVLYLAGDTFMPDTCTYLSSLTEALEEIPDVCVEDSLIISSNKESIAAYMDEANESDNHTLFDECVANLSNDAAFMLVADMDKVSQNPGRFVSYLPRFVLENASFFRSFILSSQLSLANEKLSHIMVLTYKD